MLHGNFFRGPTPEHPTPASRSGQDSYVTKGGPLGGVGVSSTSETWGGCNLINWKDLGSE